MLISWASLLFRRSCMQKGRRGLHTALSPMRLGLGLGQSEETPAPTPEDTTQQAGANGSGVGPGLPQGASWYSRR